MKYLYILFISLVANCQSKSSLSQFSFQNKMIDAFVIELPQNLDFVTNVFNTKFEIERFGKPIKTDQNFSLLKQIKNPKVSSRFIDFYYLLEELKTDNGSFVKITVLVSTGYDNFLNRNEDQETIGIILGMLDDLGVNVERRNFEIQINKIAQETQLEKQKLIILEREISGLETERNEIEKKITQKIESLKIQEKLTQDKGIELQKVKKMLSDFENATSNRSKTTLRILSKK